MVSFFTRATLSVAASIICVFAFGAPAAAPDVGLQNVALSCSDGTNLGLSLNAVEVTSLTQAVGAMALYPAGLTCGVSPQSNAPSGGNPPRDYAVGGGDQFHASHLGAPCLVNFGFSAYTPNEAPLSAQGTFNETVPGGCASLGNTGELRVDVNCLDVVGNHADMRGKVRKATGQFATGEFPSAGPFVVGGDAYISTDDNMDTLDTLWVKPTSEVPTTPATPCGGVTDKVLVSHGNITVHDAA
jgi:hypothetical protein